MTADTTTNPDTTSDDTGTEETEIPTRFAFFSGCVSATEQYAYELSMRNLAAKLDIELVDVEGFSCCGAPLRSINLNLPLFFSARNLALSEQAGLDILTLCPQCHLAFSEAKAALDENDTLRTKINGMLSSEGLEYTGDLQIWHTVDLLHDAVGLDAIKRAVVAPLNAASDDADDAEAMTMAAHYGCHLIRPSAIGRPDHAENPQKIEALLDAVGLATDDYPERLNCCGAPLMANLPDSALTLAGQKLNAVAERGFSGLVTACPWGHRQFDTKQEDAASAVGKKFEVPVVYVTQLVGLALGLSAKEVGLQMNLSAVDTLALPGSE